MIRGAPPGRVFGMPAVLALVSAAGLVVGLLGDGWYDTAAGLAVGVPVAVSLWSLAKAQRGGWG